jgi:CheY-like chemotaxis protein
MIPDITTQTKNLLFREIYMSTSTHPTVLIIEDDPDSVYLMQRYLRSTGCRVVSTSVGEEAVALAQQEKPTAIVLDIALPGMDGWEVLRALRSNVSTSDIPVVMCSALEEEAHGREAGANGYLHKPVFYPDFRLALIDVGLNISL